MQGQFALAWRFAVVSRMGKHLPARPEALWRNPKAGMTPTQMHRHMRESVAEMKKAAGPQKRRK